MNIVMPRMARSDERTGRMNIANAGMHKSDDVAGSKEAT